MRMKAVLIGACFLIVSCVAFTYTTNVQRLNIEHINV